MAPLIVAIDWDATLVDDDQEWLPGALDGLRWLRKEKHKVIIHSARCNWDGGRDQIESKLAKHKLSFDVVSKPYADFYIDDKALKFTRWPEAIKEVRSAKAQRS